MGCEVLPELSKKTSVEMKTFINKIYFYSAQELVDYWKATTFYSPENEKAVCKEIDLHFKNNDNLVVEKHIIAYIATKI